MGVFFEGEGSKVFLFHFCSGGEKGAGRGRGEGRSGVSVYKAFYPVQISKAFYPVQISESTAGLCHFPDAECLKLILSCTEM